MKKLGILSAGLLAFGCQMLHAQLAVDVALTPTQLVQNVLLGSGVTVSNVSFNGMADPGTAQQGSGAFTSTGGNLGLDAGIILASGFAQNVAQAQTGFMSDQPTMNYVDADLQVVAGGIGINNSAVLEFDFVTTGDSIKFRYVFGSEEYPEFVCSFNDAFGFFLSGPGISGPYSNGAENIAIVPGTLNTPVTIDNVNNGLNNNGNPDDPTCPPVNPEYFIDNTGGTTIVFDGFTAVLEARYQVQCGETYHIKLAICDALDQAYDSGVFLEAGSFSSTPFVPALTPGPGIVGTNTILESCYPVTIDFTQIGDTDQGDTNVVYIQVSGTATPGVDYIPAFPDSLVFYPGDSIIPFVFNCPIDFDGQETIILTLISESACAGTTINSEFIFFIESAPSLITTGGSEVIPCLGTAELLTNTFGGYAPYTVAWPTGETGPSISVSPLQDTTYTVTVTDDCGTTTTAEFIVQLTPLPPLFMALIGPGTLMEACQSNQVNFIRPVGIPGAVDLAITFEGSATNGTDFVWPTSVTIPEDVLNVVVPFQPLEDNTPDDGETVTLTATFTDDCGRTVSASVTITIVDAPAISVSTPDFIIPCQPDSMMLIATGVGGVGQLSYVWSNGDTGPTTWVTMQIPGTYTVTATDECGRSVSDNAVITVDCEVIIPNVITPNGDGQNDKFAVEGILYVSNTVRIFNRWGQTVYEASNYRNQWDGGDLPDGTYFYEITVARKDQPFTGQLTILRNGW